MPSFPWEGNPVVSSPGRFLKTIPAPVVFLGGIGFAPCRAVAADGVVLQLRRDHRFRFAGDCAALRRGDHRDAGLDAEIRPATLPGKKILGAVREAAEGRADFGIGAAPRRSRRTGASCTTWARWTSV